MNSINISQKAKNKHLNFSHYEFIINSLIQFNASHPGKRNIGKTQFIVKPQTLPIIITNKTAN